MLPAGSQHSGSSSSTHVSPQSSSQEDLSTSLGATTLSKPLELVSDVKDEDHLPGKSPENGNNCNGIVIECAVCLQNCIHPVKLPCSHIFCYLCVKGVAFQSRRCAMCRQEIPSDFLLHPQLLDRTQLEKETTLEDGYQWFYEGRNGWWMYEERTSSEIESAYKRSQRICELLIAGLIYMIDFDQMLQYRKQEPSRRRRIKRDLASIPKKGVAGLRLEQGDAEIDQQGAASLDLLSVAASRAALNSNCLSPSQTPQVPSNTPQTPQTPRSPPSPAPETSGSNPNQDSGTAQALSIGAAVMGEARWQERERRRLRRAVEEIERLRLHDGEPHPPRLDNITPLVYYDLDEHTAILDDENQDLWPSGESTSSSSSSEEEENNTS